MNGHSAREPAQPAERTLTVDVGAGGQRLDKWLSASLTEMSRVRVRALIEEGCVLAGDAIVTDPRLKIRVGEKYRVDVPDGAVVSVTPVTPIALHILFEDEHVIVVNKPVGVVVHPAPGHRAGGTLSEALVRHVGPEQAGIGAPGRPGIVHRLDKDTSGILVAARSARAYTALKALFAEHDIEREYLAYTCAAPTPLTGEIKTAIVRHPGDYRKMAVGSDQTSARPARTAYRTLRVFGPTETGAVASMVACGLHTGRTHQIRVHMAHAGAPIIGDKLYGGRRGIRVPDSRSAHEALAVVRSFPRQALHAFRLSFAHPVTGETMRFETPLPLDMRRLAAALAVALGYREVCG